MTIKLLAAYGKYPPNAIITLDSTTETSLIADKVATSDTTGGVVWVDPNVSNPLNGTSTTLGPVASSRTALASDNGGTFELANGVTYTLDSAVALPAGVILIGPASGSATIAVAGSATINGGTTSVTVSAGQAYTALPRATSAASFVVKGS